MIFEMLRWWYGAGWLRAAQHSITWSKRMGQAFSVPLLARTLFAPWRRIVSLGGRSFDERIRAAFDNLVSRCVGSVVRTLVLITAAIAVCMALILAVLLTVVWPLLPVAFIYFVVRSITG